MKNKHIQLFLVLAIGLLSVSKAQDIQDISGVWTLVLCDESTPCKFYFNLTIDLTIDANNNTLANSIHLLNGIKNSYQAFEEQYTYQEKNAGTYTLNPVAGGQEYTLVIFDNETLIAYSISEITHKSQGNYQIYGFQRQHAIDDVKLLDKMNVTLPNFPFNVAGFQSLPLQFSTAPNFDLNLLTSKIWYVTSEWLHSSRNGLGQPTDLTQDLCIQSIFAKNWTNGIGGLQSEYNYASLQSDWSEDEIVTFYGWVNYPDPVINSWIHQDARHDGIIYADDSKMVFLDDSKSVATLFTADPLFNAGSYATFTAQLVKMGINPLSGTYQNYNNSACDPDQFKLSSLVGAQETTWVIPSIASSSDNPSSFQNMACLNAVFSYESAKSNQINMQLTGINFENQTYFDTTISFLFHDGDERNLYPVDHPDSPFYITAFNPTTLMLVRRDGDTYEAFTLVHELEEIAEMYNQFLLAPFFPGETVQLPYAFYQCKPPIAPTTNVTLDLLSEDWHTLASYQSFYPNTAMSCWQWSFTNSSKYPSPAIDIISHAFMDYGVLEYVGTNSPLPGANGYMLPQVTHIHADVYNQNKTELWLTVYYFTGDTMILLNDDFINADVELYYLSKSTVYSPDEEKLFKEAIGILSGDFEEEFYHVVDNDGCQSWYTQ